MKIETCVDTPIPPTQRDEQSVTNNASPLAAPLASLESTSEFESLQFNCISSGSEAQNEF